MSRLTKASYATLAAVTIAHFLNHAYTGALSPLLPFIKDELSLSLTEIGIIASAAVVAQTIAHLLVGYLGDRGWRWRDAFISSSIFLSAIALVLTSYSSDFIILVVFQAFLGIGASGYHPSVFPTLAEKFPQRNLAKATGLQAMGGLVGTAIIPFLGVTLLVALGGWRPSLIVLGLIGFVLFVPVVILMRTSRNENETRFMDASEECKGEDKWTQDYWLSLLLMGLRGMSFRCTSLLMPIYLVATYTEDPIWAGYLTTIMLSAGLVGEIISAPLSDKLNRRVPFLIISTGLVTPALLLLNFSINQFLLISMLVIIGFFFYLGVPPLTAYMTEVSPSASRGLAFGLLFSLGAIPGAVSPIIFGWIGDVYGLPTSILFLVVTTAFATVVPFFMKENNQVAKGSEAYLFLDSVAPPE